MSTVVTLSTIDKIRQISESKQDTHIDGVFIDFMTAKAIIKAYDAMNPEKKSKFEAMKVRHMATIAFDIHSK